MFKAILSAIWRALPSRAVRAAVLAHETRFTVTAAAVVTDHDGRVLLLEHAFRAGNAWGIPGGFIGRDEQPQDALRRELREEVGVELDDVRLVFARTVASAPQVQLIYRAAVRGRPEPRTVEVRSVEWVTRDEIGGRLNESQRRIVERALEGG